MKIRQEKQYQPKVKETESNNTKELNLKIEELTKKNNQFISLINKILEDIDTYEDEIEEDEPAYYKKYNGVISVKTSKTVKVLLPKSYEKYLDEDKKDDNTKK